MKFSYVMLPDYSLAECVESIKLADRLGFYACYAADETWHKDLWLLFAHAADKTRNIRFGSSLSAVTLREPSLLAQTVATLDELTDGRAECVISSGNFGLLAEYNIDWTKSKPLSRVKEAHHVLRTLLDEGAVTFDGDFYSYNGLFTLARPRQERLPVKLGAMRGPKSFQVAGEISDGVHHALSYTSEAYEYCVDNFRIGAERAGRDWTSLDVGAWCVCSVGEDPGAALDAARTVTGLYASAMPAEQLRRNGVDPASLEPIVAALGKGDMQQAYDLTSRDLADKLSISGTADQVVEKIKTQIAPSGVNHLILAITDRSLVKGLTGIELNNVPVADEQLQLIHDRIMPAFA